MNRGKVYRTIEGMTRLTGRTRFTARELFDGQKRVLDYNSNVNPRYWPGYDAILKRHKMTRPAWNRVLNDPTLYSFYSHGLPKQYEAMNKELAKYCRAHGIFIRDWTDNAFFAHCNNAIQSGVVTRRKNQQGVHEYSLNMKG